MTNVKFIKNSKFCMHTSTYESIDVCLNDSLLSIGVTFLFLTFYITLRSLTRYDGVTHLSSNNFRNTKLHTSHLVVSPSNIHTLKSVVPDPQTIFTY